MPLSHIVLSFFNKSSFAILYNTFVFVATIRIRPRGHSAAASPWHHAPRCRSHRQVPLSVCLAIGILTSPSLHFSDGRLPLVHSDANLKRDPASDNAHIDPWSENVFRLRNEDLNLQTRDPKIKIIGNKTNLTKMDCSDKSAHVLR